MAFVYKHHEVTGGQLRRVQADPGSAVSPADVAVLEYLTLTPEKRGYALGKYVIGRFDSVVASINVDGSTRVIDCLHTGSCIGDDYKEIARGVVVEDEVDPDGLYEIYVPI